MHYFLLGPSGVGKTTFANWLEANREYLHIAVDRGDDPSALITKGLIEQWVKLRNGDPAPFASELQKRAETAGKKGCVLTFWSVIFYPPDGVELLATHNIAVRYLYGPKRKCIEAFVDRENRPERDETFWSSVNLHYENMGGPELVAYRADVIKPSGERLNGQEIAELLKID